MTNDEIIKQLESLLAHCKSMIEKDGGFPIWEKDCEALEAAIAALRPSGEPPIDREKWEPCEWCGSVGKKPDNWVCTLEDDDGHTVTNNHIVVCATANYCPSCGRPLTEAAWTELEKRVRSVNHG